ncbi:excinuclease ABC subunit C [Candidatus Parcubacteria bacterium 4484_255]|nr:MAG: excinuclease ABC subunit C [Candidatus Parcubacteria bacterium 4484_255]
MFYVYILKSRKDGKLYIGYTNNLQKRFEEHNKGLVKSTKHRIPFDLVYCETYFSNADAKHREDMLKRHSGSYIHLKKRIKNSLIIPM